ncbi:MAG TPA: hypothetical protein VG477_00990 [Thermoanaerobaculia bacterium]|nr:hypothetical protein [Thermoanaerobaculia bacterium]
MKKIRLFALAGALGLVALTGAEADGIQLFPIDTFCMCACPDGTAVCVSSINGDCGVPCAQAAQTLCRSDM